MFVCVFSIEKLCVPKLFKIIIKLPTNTVCKYQILVKDCCLWLIYEIVLTIRDIIIIVNLILQFLKLFSKFSVCLKLIFLLRGNNIRLQACWKIQNNIIKNECFHHSHQFLNHCLILLTIHRIFFHSNTQVSDVT